MKGFILQSVLLMILRWIQFLGVQSYFINLGGDEWTATSSSPKSTVITRISKATVPGCIHMDWYNHIGHDKEHNPYYRFNDGKWRDITDRNWAYERTFAVDGSLNKHREYWLVCEGLDTVANISLNSKALGTSKNMFIRNFFNITGILQNHFNRITISFESATRYANKSRSTLKYPIPPECPPGVQHGFCHVNLLRKEQSSFSWDWGPGFATQGIWKPIYVIGIDQVLLTDISISYNWDSEELSIDARFHVAGSSKNISGTFNLFVDELSINNVSCPVFIDDEKPFTNILQNIPKKNIKPWWPNGQGEQKLYNITVEFYTNDLTDRSLKTTWFGFRNVELVQTPINGSSGLSFYLKINGRPIFAKGSNWIPADAFSTRVSLDNYTNLLQSAKDANMNILRVWGGGIYESDEFYNLADSMGIMIWHDFMFACAMYPSDVNFLESVSQEVEDALWRLKSHPSIVLWAGNNENEAALATNWYNTSSKFEKYKKDYIALYVDTIGKVVTDLDSTRPFLTSSPTNGYESKEEDWVAKNPYDTHYGDTHYYNYDADCMDWTTFPKTRFASEYGYQSFSSIKTMLIVSLPTDLTWNSSFIVQRNHHLDGNNQILQQVLKHFNVTLAESDKKYFENLVYLSQIMQGLCYKSETEFYRRGRSEVVDGEGHTMGALYWQLNDIWQTTSWSSLEYGGKWKAVHYFARNFFANVTLSAYDDGHNNMNVYSISDNLDSLNSVTLVIEMNLWGEFGDKHKWQLPINIIPQSSTLIYSEEIDIMVRKANCEGKEKCYFVIFIKEMPDVPSTYFYPVSFKRIAGMKTPHIQIEDVTLLQSVSSRVIKEEYSITLTSEVPAFFVFLEANNITGRFSDNAFHIGKTKTTIVFYAWQSTSASAVKSSIRIKSLADSSLGDDIYNTTAISNESNMIHNTAIDLIAPAVVWLDVVEAKLAFGLCGLLFLLFFAVLLVCVIMRFSPYINKSSTMVTQPERQERPASIARETDDNDSNESSAAFLLNLRDQSTPNKRGVDVMFYIR